MCCEECFIGEKKKKDSAKASGVCFWTGLPAAACTASAGDWGSLGAPPLRLPPLFPAAEGPKPRPAPRGWGCSAERPAGQLGACKEPGEPLGLEQHKDRPIPSSPCRARSCCAWCGAGGTEGKEGWAGRGLPAGVGVRRSIQRLGAARQHPATPPRGVTEARVGLGGWQQAGAPCVGGGSGVGRELAPAASSWLTWLLQGPGPRAATPSFGQPRFLAWEVPPKLQGPPAARTPPAMGSAVPCP